MIPRLTRTFSLLPADQALIDALIPFNGNSWKNGTIEPVKEEILTQLLEFQNNNCCYCGLKVNETGRGELDHILKKGGPKRPAYLQYVFTPFNLAVSCQYCNSSSKKGQEDVIDHPDPVNYHLCTFTIVHPYYDNPEIHYAWTNGRFEILIRGLTPKAHNSIRIFELDQESQTTARAKQIRFERDRARYNLRQDVIDRIKRIVLFKR